MSPSSPVPRAGCCGYRPCRASALRSRSRPARAFHRRAGTTAAPSTRTFASITTWRVSGCERTPAQRAARRPALAFLRDVRGDLTYAARLFARQPAILLLTIVGLSLGLGIATAAFSIMNAAVLARRRTRRSGPRPRSAANDRNIDVHCVVVRRVPPPARGRDAHAGRGRAYRRRPRADHCGSGRRAGGRSRVRQRRVFHRDRRTHGARPGPRARRRPARGSAAGRRELRLLDHPARSRPASHRAHDPDRPHRRDDRRRGGTAVLGAEQPPAVDAADRVWRGLRREAPGQRARTDDGVQVFGRLLPDATIAEAEAQLSGVAAAIPATRAAGGSPLGREAGSLRRAGPRVARPRRSRSLPWCSS